MLNLALALLLTQTQPAVRRSTPASDDPGMVVRSVGTSSVTCTNCQMAFTPDGGVIGAVTQGRGLDGGTGWGVYIEGGTLSVSSSTSFDGGSIGYMRMPDGGPLEVYTTNAGSSGGGWVPDGGFIGLVGLADGGGVFITNASVAVTGPLTDAQLRATAVPVSAASLPLPSGAATESTLSTRVADSTITARLNTLGQKTSANSTPVVLSSDQSAVPINDNGGSITVDGTVAVSGTVTTAGTTTAAQGTPAAAANRWPVQLTDGTDLALVSTGGALLTDSSATTQPVSAASLPLPTGASTSALQTTGNTSLSSIDGKTPALVSGRVPVDGSGVTQPVSGSVTVTQATGTNLHVVVDSAPTTTVTGTVTANAGTGPWPVTDNGGSLTVDGTVSANLNAGTNYVGKVRQTDGTLDLSLLNSAPGSDTGQVSIPVRVISSLAGGAGGTSSSYGAAFPASGTAAGFSDGTNMSSARTFDADTGGGTQNVLGVNLRVGASGGSAEAAAGAGTTSASTLRVVLPTDQTVIPVSDNGSSLTVDGTVALSGTSAVNVSQVGGNAVNVGSGAAGTGTQRVILATDQPVIPVGDNGGSLTVDGTVTVSGTVDTELPTASSLADATANPSTTSVGALGLLFNGTTWDRMRGDTTNGLLVNVSDSFLLDATFTGRFAAGAALSDNFANPTTTSTGAMQMVWDGATWDRAPGNSTDGQLVNLGANNDVTVTGTVTANAGSGSFTVAQGTASNLRAQTASEGATGSAVPTSASLMGASDGTNLRAPKVFDLDASATTPDWVLGTQLRVGAWGASQPVSYAQSSWGNIDIAVYSDPKLSATPTTTAVTCATTATAAPASALSSRTTVTFVNNSAVTIYIGGSGVTTANGIPLLPGASFMDDVSAAPYYCRVASGTANLRVLEN